MKRLLDPRVYLMTLMCSLLMACASLGLEAPKTFPEQVIVAQTSVTSLKRAATQLLNDKKISSSDAENVLTTTEAADKGIAVARTIALQDASAAQSRLTATLSVLTALQTYLATKR